MKKIITFTMAFAAIISMTVLSSCGSGTPTPQEEADKVIANYKTKPAKEISPIFGNYYNLINDERGLGNILYVERINCDNPEDGILQKRAEAYEIVKDYFQPLIAKEKESIENRTDIPFEFDKKYFSDAEIRIDKISENEIDFSGTFTFIPQFGAMRPHPYATFLKSDGAPAKGNIYDCRFGCKFECIEGDRYSYHFTMTTRYDNRYFIDNTEKIKLEHLI
jgi:lipoprotein